MDWLSFGLPAEGEESPNLLINHIERRVPTCRPTDSVESAGRTAAEMKCRICTVVNEQNVVLGYIDAEASASDGESTAGDVMQLGPKTLRPSSSVKEATKVAQKNGWAEILVTSSDGKLMGIFKAPVNH